MKMNKRKIIVAALAVGLGAALAGSVSGTLAWYQYSTRSTAAYSGASAHCSEALQISSDGTNFSSDLALVNLGKLKPVTTGAIAKDAALSTIYTHPVYQYSAYSSWESLALDNLAGYAATFSLYFRVLDVNGQDTATYLAKNLYLADLTLRAASGSTDITDALRVHFSTASANALVAKKATSTATTGKLDLNNDGAADKSVGYAQLGDELTELTYGEGEQTTYAVEEGKGTGKVLTDDTVANFADTASNLGVNFGTTPTDGSGLKVDVTVFIEGWHRFEEDADGLAKLWNNNTIGQTFQIGTRWAVPLHTAAE